MCLIQFSNTIERRSKNVLKYGGFAFPEQSIPRSISPLAHRLNPPRANHNRSTKLQMQTQRLLRSSIVALLFASGMWVDAIDYCTNPRDGAPCDSNKSKSCCARRYLPRDFAEVLLGALGPQRVVPMVRIALSCGGVAQW